VGVWRNPQEERGGKTQGLEGQSPKGIVVLAFDGTEKTLAWYNSPAYEAIKKNGQDQNVHGPRLDDCIERATMRM
jgi:Domain of unknown function (DUF1330)